MKKLVGPQIYSKFIKTIAEWSLKRREKASKMGMPMRLSLVTQTH